MEVMTTTNLTCRTALLGTVTLPAAMAPLGLAQGAEANPAVAAYREWVDALLANNADPHDDARGRAAL